MGKKCDTLFTQITPNLMKPKQFRQIREGKKFSRRELAHHLGCSASAIDKWERGERPIPKWAIEKMIVDVEITLSLDSLNTLTRIAASSGVPLQTFLTNTIRNLASGQETSPILAEDPDLSAYKSKK